MKGKTKMIAMAISLVIFLGLITAGWFAHHNTITLWIGAFFLFFYFPVHFWDAQQRIKQEKRAARWEEVNKSHQEIFDIFAGKERKRHDDEQS